MPATTGALGARLVSLEIRRALGAPLGPGRLFGGQEGWASGGHQRTPSTTMTKVGCVFYYENPVSSCKNGANEPNLTKIGLSSDEKQTQTPNVSWHIW